MKLLTVNHAKSCAFAGWTREVRFINDGRCYVEGICQPGLRVSSELLVSQNARVFPQVQGNDKTAYTRSLLVLTQAGIVKEPEPTLIVSAADANRDPMIWFYNAPALTVVATRDGAARAVAKDIFKFRPGQKVRSKGYAPCGSVFESEWTFDGRSLLLNGSPVLDLGAA